jgi:hypothetical protein
MAGKEIQQLAIKRANEEIGENPGPDWSGELSQMETLILSHIASPFGEFQADAVQQLIHRIAYDGEFMLALVFNQDYTKVTALPLPEVFEGNNRVQLASSTIAARENIHYMLFVIEAKLAKHPTPGTSNRVIVVEQNMDDVGNKKPLLIGTWNFREAHRHNQTKPYDTWVKALDQEPAGIHPSGK